MQHNKVTVADLYEDAMRYRNIHASIVGVLNDEEAQDYANRSNAIHEINTTLFDIEGNPCKYWFYASNHMFGYSALGKESVPSTTHLPYRVVPREELPSGMVCNVKDYRAIHKADGIQITDMVMLAAVINTDHQYRFNVLIERTKARKLAKKKQPILYPSFFPRGTVVETSVEDEVAHYTVDKVQMNGPFYSYLEMQETKVANNQVEKPLFNVAYVSRIVKMGEGKLVIERNIGDFPVNKSLWYRTYDVAGYSEEALAHLMTSTKGAMARDITVYGCTEDKTNGYDFTFKPKVLVQSILKLLVKVRIVNDTVIVSCNKKKFKRWFKQNRNRFLQKHNYRY